MWRDGAGLRAWGKGGRDINRQSVELFRLRCLVVARLFLLTFHSPLPKPSLPIHVTRIQYNIIPFCLYSLFIPLRYFHFLKLWRNMLKVIRAVYAHDCKQFTGMIVSVILWRTRWLFILENIGQRDSGPEGG